MNDPYLIFPNIDAKSLNISYNGVELVYNKNSIIISQNTTNDAYMIIPILTYWGELVLPEDYVLEFDGSIPDNANITLIFDVKDKEWHEIDVINNFKISLADLGIENIKCKHLKLTGQFGDGTIINRLAIVHKDYKISEGLKKRFHLLPNANWRSRENSLQDMFDFNPDNIQKDDIVILRPVPENYSEQQLIEMEKDILPYKKAGCKIYNEPTKIINGHFKEKTLRIWNENGISTPRWKIVSTRQEVINFLDIYGYKSVLLKHNDKHSGIGQHTATKSDIKSIHPNTMLMEIVRTNIDYDLVGKAYVVDGKVFNIHGYMFIRNQDINYAKHTCVDYDAWILGMEVIYLVSQKHIEEISKAVSLICDTGSIDYIIREDTLVFLEVNPYWGSGNTWGTVWPNNIKFSEEIKKDKRDWTKDIHERMDEFNLWVKYFNLLNSD